jgi:hypothetical protein
MLLFRNYAQNGFLDILQTLKLIVLPKAIILRLEPVEIPNNV